MIKSIIQALIFTMISVLFAYLSLSTVIRFLGDFGALCFGLLFAVISVSSLFVVTVIVDNAADSI